MYWDQAENRAMMARGMYLYYSEKYPESRELLQEIERALERAMDAINFHSIGGVGMLRGWVERFRELDEQDAAHTDKRE